MLGLGGDKLRVEFLLGGFLTLFFLGWIRWQLASLAYVAVDDLSHSAFYKEPWPQAGPKGGLLRQRTQKEFSTEP
jgi:hypothetical protein